MLEQIATIGIAELGRHNTVHEPREAEIFCQRGKGRPGTTTAWQLESGVAQEHVPAHGAQRKCEVEDDEGQEVKCRIDLAHLPDRLRRVDVDATEDEENDA